MKRNDAKGIFIYKADVGNGLKDQRSRSTSITLITSDRTGLNVIVNCSIAHLCYAKIKHSNWLKLVT